MKSKLPKVPLVEAVSRALCLASVNAPEDYIAEAEQAGQPRFFCLHCKDEQDCTLWNTFEKEARAAIQTIRKSDRGK
jgi:hypothetical protein